jgi:hypothetical protein
MVPGNSEDDIGSPVGNQCWKDISFFLHNNFSAFFSLLKSRDKSRYFHTKFPACFPPSSTELTGGTYYPAFLSVLLSLLIKNQRFEQKNSVPFLPAFH